MKLVKSRLTGIQCIKCDCVIPTNTLRFVDGGMHYCFTCPCSENEKRMAEDEQEIS